MTRSILIISLAICAFGSARAGEWSGAMFLEGRWFIDSPRFPDQAPDHASSSAAFVPQWRWESADGRDRVTVEAHARWDQYDSERSHLDLREANWERFFDDWTLEVGLGRVFWGVTESRHLVDIINQTDAVEDIDEEDKLGQPMVSIETLTDTGTWSFWALPGFRERTFPAADARLRGPLAIASHAVFESGAGRRRVDAAARWSHVAGAWDVGLSGFYGTSREPRLVFDSGVLVPHYDVIGQVGLDLQWTQGAWLWKGEAIRRSGPRYSLTAAVVGFEATRFGLWGGSSDLSLLAEWLHDDRPAIAPATIYDDDLFLGARWARNDAQDTAMLLGIIRDRDDGGQVGFLEAERRLTDSWKLEIEARWFHRIPDSDLLLWGIQNDSFVTVRLARFL